MLRNRKWINLVVLAVFAGFVYGAAQLYLLRFTTGEVYAPYSTLRADPLGTKALYESLQNMPGLSVQRLLRPFTMETVRQTLGNRAATVFVLGALADDPDHAPLEFVRTTERIMVEGGRVVIAFAPTSENLRVLWTEYDMRMKRRERNRSDESAEGKNEDDAKAEREPDAPTEKTPEAEREETEATDDTGADSESEKDTTTEEEEENDDEESSPYDFSLPAVDITERWGVRLEFDPVQVTADRKIRSEWAEWKAEPGLPSSVSWHTATSFGHLSDEWRVLYERNTKPVLIERPFGAGSLVLSSDSYYLSNEALRNERHPALLAWLVGRNALVVFDESHLGLGRNPGIMTLAKSYGLYSVFGGLVLLAMLYIWKNSASFVPPYEDEAVADARQALGKDSAAGFANLIRRSVKGRDLLDTCLAEYARSLGQRRDDLAEPLRQMQAVAQAERTKAGSHWKPIEAYREMSRFLAEYLGRHS